MIDSLLDLPPHVRDRLASALESEFLVSPLNVTAVGSVVGNREYAERATATLLELDQVGVSGRGAAAWLRTMEQASARVRKPDLVWSGPEAAGLHARDTRRVYDELLGNANRSVWACTYAFFDGPKAFGVLARRMEVAPALKVNLLLNVQRKRGDTTNSDQLVRQFADQFWRTDWPGASRPSVYYDPRALDLQRPSGVLHAKAVVVDDEAVFITSANMTEAALDRNIELGVVMHDRALALSVCGYFGELVSQSFLKPLPMV